MQPNAKMRRDTRNVVCRRMVAGHIPKSHNDNNKQKENDLSSSELCKHKGLNQRFAKSQIRTSNSCLHVESSLRTCHQGLFETSSPTDNQ
eukprot:1239675-Amphidinium_carterae.1